MSHPCDMCDFPILDTAYVCPQCAGFVARHLRQGAENFAELYLQIARQVRFGDRVRLSGAEPPLPFSLEASIDYGSIVNTITTWARHIAAERGEIPPSAGRNLMLWLAEDKQTGWLRYRKEAAQAFDELDYAARLVERAIDAPAQHWYAGRCLEQGCEAELYARPNASIIRCRECGTEHDADARKDWLLEQANDVLGTATEISRLVSAMRGDLVTSSQVRGLAFRGRIVAHGVDLKGRPTYRVGDVLAVIQS